MAVVDYKSRLSTNQAITGDAASTNVIDFGVADPNMGAGSPLFLRVTVTENFASATSTGTVQVKLQDSADNSTWRTLSETDAFLVTALTSGFEFVKLALPDEHERYVRAFYECGVEDPTAGAVNAWVDVG